MREEIGGYLEFERFSGNALHKESIALDSGRSCLLYLIELRGIQHIWMPEWMCASVFDACRKAGVDVYTYQVDDALQPILDFDMDDKGYLYIADFYGRLTEESVAKTLTHAKGRLIVDEAQGFFRKPWSYADTLYTCRKFFGVPDGGYLYTADGGALTRSIPVSQSHAAMGHILGRFEGRASDFFDLSLQNEERFGALGGPSQMSLLTSNLMGALDYDGIKMKRTRNYERLGSKLDGINALPRVSIEGPYMYPLRCEDSVRLRERLLDNHVYIPTLWPNVVNGSRQGSAAWRLAHDIVPLPVDQRYGDEEMDFIATVILDSYSDEQGGCR